MKIFIINLNRSKDRKEYMQGQFDKIGLDCEFFSAIDGGNLDRKWLSKVAKSKFYNQITGRAGFAKNHSNNEIACFASHFSLWQKCIELNEPIIVLEDDVILGQDFKKSITTLEKYLDKLQYIRLMVLLKHREKLELSDNLYLYTCFPSGTQGYAITPKAAKSFVYYAKKWHEPVDMYMDLSLIHGLRAYCVNPEAIGESEIPSEIGTVDRKYLPKPVSVTKLIRELVPPIQQLRQIYWNWRNPIFYPNK
jgi:glycosyl transferase family 25